MKFITVCLLMTGWAIGAEDWPRYLGPNRDGSVAAPGLFGDVIYLRQLWNQPLGSGFSGIVVGGGKVYTMHTSGEQDALSCFEASTGEKRWSYAYGPTFPKVGSSEPGPLSTPVLDGNRIYGLGAHGELFCLDTDKGNLIWSHNIVRELGAVPRETGVGSSPLIHGNLLVLNVGDRKDKSIAAFDKRTGSLAWHLGDEQISFQSPALVTLLGQEQILALSASKMRGIEPTTGKELWSQNSSEWIQSFSIGHDQVLLANFGKVALHQIDNYYGYTKVTEKWSSDELLIEYDMPVHHKGYLFGFKRGFLNCLNLATGERVWRTWDAGQGMVILVDGHLAILDEEGTFHIAHAWEKGYKERASIQVFEKSGLTPPSYADGVFYFRNYSHLAAVRVNAF